MNKAFTRHECDAITLSVSSEDLSCRLDSYIAQKTGLTRAQVQRHIEKGLVRVNEALQGQNYRIRADDKITLVREIVPEPSLVPEEIPLRFYYKDEFLAVLEKPAGMVVYPSAGHARGTLINAVYYHCKKTASVGLPLRPGIVHRLDKDTSGIMVVALEDSAYYDLVEQFRKREVSRRYIALIYGCPKADSGEISYAIGRAVNDRKKMSVKTSSGKDALTRWKIVKRFNKAALIEIRLGTGRTHQIRVHFSAIGHPVLGDHTYSSKTYIEKAGARYPLNRQMLHAESIGFRHPISRSYLEFTSPMTEDITDCIALLQQ